MNAMKDKSALIVIGSVVVGMFAMAAAIGVAFRGGTEWQYAGLAQELGLWQFLAHVGITIAGVVTLYGLIYELTTAILRFLPKHPTTLESSEITAEERENQEWKEICELAHRLSEDADKVR